MELGATQSHQFMPECGGKHQVSVRHHGLCDAVEAHNVAEECLSTVYRWASKMKWLYLLKRLTTVTIIDFPPTHG
jgi:hypothetical protein